MTKKEKEELKQILLKKTFNRDDDGIFNALSLVNTNLWVSDAIARATELLEKL